MSVLRPRERAVRHHLRAALAAAGIAVVGSLALCPPRADSLTVEQQPQAAPTAADCGGTSGCIPLGSQRQLFVDDTFISSLTGGASLVLQQPRVANAALIQDKPWEGSWGEGESTVDDNGHYFMYYQCGPDTTDGQDNLGTPVNDCVVESTDGITWTRPDLGQVSFAGSTDNNIMSIPDQAEVGTQFYPFIDTNPATPANQRFKAVAGGNVQYKKADGTTWDRGLYLMVSGDGVHWREYSPTPFLPDEEQIDQNGQYVRTGAYDSLNSMSYDAALGEYVCYYRLWTPEPTTDAGAQYRWVGVSTSKDLKTWTPWGKAMGYGGQPQQWYFGDTFPYFRAPQTYVAMPSEYVGTSNLPLSGLFPNPVTAGHGTRSATHFAVVSGDGTTYDRSLDPTNRWITTGLDDPAPRQFGPGQQGYPDWAGRLGLNVVPTGPTQMSMYLEQPGRVVRYTLRTDGFVALNAGTGGGQMDSKPFTFSGQTLELNYQVLAGGSVRVELDDADGNAIPGFDLAHSIPMTGNQISQTVAWTGGDKVGSLAGTVVRLKLVLNNANVYSLAFDHPPVARPASVRWIQIAIGGGWAVFVIGWLAAATTARSGRNHHRRRSVGIRVLVGLIIVAVVGVLPPFRASHRTVEHDVPLAVVGLAIFVTGVAIAGWARVKLGRNWGTPMSRRRKTELVTTGPYRWVRNPIYSGMILALVGTALALAPLWLVVVVLPSGFFVYCSVQEQRYLLEQFPDTYPAYRDATKLLIPFVF